MGGWRVAGWKSLECRGEGQAIWRTSERRQRRRRVSEPTGRSDRLPSRRCSLLPLCSPFSFAAFKLQWAVVDRECNGGSSRGAARLQLADEKVKGKGKRERPKGNGKKAPDRRLKGTAIAHQQHREAATGHKHQQQHQQSHPFSNLPQLHRKRPATKGTGEFKEKIYELHLKRSS